MSRWIVAVLIDFSTILTVNLGGLPIIAMNGDETSSAWVKTTQVKYLTMHAQFDMDSSNDATTDKADHTVVYSCFGNKSPNKYYLPCWIENGVFIQEWNVDWSEPQSWFGYRAWFIKSRANIGSGTLLNDSSINDEFCTYQYDLLVNCSISSDVTYCWTWNTTELTSKRLEELKARGAEEMTTKWCSTLQDFLTKAKGMTGPLYNLYATILNMGQIALSSNHDSLVATWVNMFMKVIVGIALILPLFALAVVLIMRVVILWVVIAFSPFLIVMYVFDYQVPGVGKKGSMGNILGLIFLPVFATFAISISALFLTLIWRIDLIQNNQKVDALQVLGADKVTCDGKWDAGSADCRCYKFFGMSICVDQSARTTGANILNTLSWLVTNFFGIALMWSIIFFALKSNDITWSVSEKIGSRGKGILANTSMIPIPGMGMVSPGALQSASKNIWRMPDRIADSSFNNSWLGKFVGNLENKMSGNKTSTPPADTDKKLEEKVKKNDVQVEDMKNAVAADKNYADYKQIAPALVAAAKASGKTVTYAGDNLIEAMKDVGVVQYMQQHDLLDQKHWVKDGAQQQTTDYQTQLKASLEATPTKWNTKDQGRYWMPHTDPNNPNDNKWYFTKVKRDAQGNITNVENIAYTPKAPTALTDWKSVGDIVQWADVDILQANTQATTLFGQAWTDIHDAVIAWGSKTITIAGRNHRLSVMLTPNTRDIATVSIVPIP